MRPERRDSRARSWSHQNFSAPLLSVGTTDCINTRRAVPPTAIGRARIRFLGGSLIYEALGVRLDICPVFEKLSEKSRESKVAVPFSTRRSTCWQVCGFQPMQAKVLTTASACRAAIGLAARSAAAVRRGRRAAARLREVPQPHAARQVLPSPAPLPCERRDDARARIRSRRSGDRRSMNSLPAR